MKSTLNPAEWLLFQAMKDDRVRHNNEAIKWQVENDQLRHRLRKAEEKITRLLARLPKRKP